MNMIEKNNDNLETLIGPYSKHCKGYVNSGRNCYLCAITLHTAVIDETSTEKLHSNILPIKSIYKLNAFDLAESSGAYVGQINMITVSSFSGPMGYLWGLDFASHDTIKNHKESLNLKSLKIQRHDNKKIKIYDAQLLIESSKALFGEIVKKEDCVEKNLHFPLMPGAHVPCVNEFYYSEKYDDEPEKQDKYVYCGLGIGIPEDPNNDATLFMQFAGGSAINLKAMKTN